MDYISVVESLRISSTTFTQCTAKAIEFTEIVQNNVIQGHRFWYQLKAHVRFPISD